MDCLGLGADNVGAFGMLSVPLFDDQRDVLVPRLGSLAQGDHPALASQNQSQPPITQSDSQPGRANGFAFSAEHRS